MDTNPAALRETLAKCRDIIEQELEALLESCCILDYPDGVDAAPVPRRDTLDENVRPVAEAMEAVLAEVRRGITRFPIGARVQLARDVIIADGGSFELLGRWPAGTTGTITWAANPDDKLDDGLLATVRLDGDHPALAEWDGCLQVYLNADDDCAWWKWEPAPTEISDEWIWYSVQTPSVFKECRVPRRGRWTKEHQAAWDELTRLAEQHGTSIQSSSYRRG